jgi:hypothetical protein
MVRYKWYAMVLAFAMVGAAAAQTAADNKLMIRNGKVEYVDDNSAKLAWTTNVESSAVVRYGTDPNNLDMVAREAWGGKKVDESGAIHRVELKNLKPDTTYYFVIEAGEARGGGGYTFKTSVQQLRTKTVEQAREEWRAKQQSNPK